MILNSFKFKLSIIYSFILGVVLVLYSLFLYWGLSTSLYEELDNELKTKANAAAHVLGLYLKAAGDSPRVVDYVFNRISFPEDVDARLEVVAKIDLYWAQQLGKLNMQDDLMQLIAPEGEVLGRSRRLSNDLKQIFLAETAGLEPGGERYFSDIYYKKSALRLVSMPCIFQGEAGYILQVASSQKPVIQLLKNRLYSIIISVPFIFIVMLILGIILVHQLMKPVLHVTKAAQSISHKDLSRRLETRYGDEEMRQLVAAFNDMIGRLEKSFDHIEEFSGQVAHELRTPLTIMKGESELALRKERSIDEYQRVIRVSLEEIDRMLHTVEALLLLARLEYHPGSFKKDVFDLFILENEVFEQMQLLGRKKQIRVEMEFPSQAVMLNGDRHHLRRLLMNLADNAVKFSFEHGEIKLKTVVKGNKVIISLKDNGAGIDPLDQAKIFDRFFHKSHSLNGGDGGCGLGLSIALTIARGHGGDIQVESIPGSGTKMSVELPIKGNAGYPG